MGLIETRRGGRAGESRRPPVPAAAAAAPLPPAAPAVPRPASRGPCRPVPVGGPDTGPVRLAGAQVPIGPGPRVADARAAAVKAPPPEAGLVASWSTPRPGVNGTEPAVGPAVTGGPGRAPEPAAGWRPWRFRMSNDVWGTPSVAGDLVYVTSFEVHALDVGHRPPPLQDAGRGLVDGGRGRPYPRLRRAHPVRPRRPRGRRPVAAEHGRLGVLPQGRPGHGRSPAPAAAASRPGRPPAASKLWELTGCQTDFESPEAGPALHEGTVYIWQDARLRALDARTGDERWSYPIGDAASCGGVPVRVAQAHDGFVYVSAGTRVMALDVASGRVRWHFEAPAVFLCPPTFVPGRRGHRRRRVPRRLPRHGVRPRRRGRPRPLADRHRVPGVGGAGARRRAAMCTWAAARACTRWTRSPERPKWRFQAGGDIVGAPAVAEGRIHFGSTDHLLYTLKADDGRLRWKLATGGEITGSPVVKDGVVYACSKDRCVYALDAEKGTGTARAT